MRNDAGSCDGGIGESRPGRRYGEVLQLGIQAPASMKTRHGFESLACDPQRQIHPMHVNPRSSIDDLMVLCTCACSWAVAA